MEAPYKWRDTINIMGKWNILIDKENIIDTKMITITFSVYANAMTRASLDINEAHSLRDSQQQ
jgi:hypothetical protein